VDNVDKSLSRPICVAEHLAPFLPTHPLIPTGGAQAIDSVSAAPFGSASILLISWAYIKMLGGQGLTDSSRIALLNANYMAHRLSGHYSLRFKNANGRVAHELLIDLAEFDKAAGLKVNDFAKRLQVRSLILSSPLSSLLTFGRRTTASTRQLVLGQFPHAC
jgi:glycine dehydrogenase